MGSPKAPVLVDHTPCLIRHVRRRRDTEPYVTVIAAEFHSAGGAELDALNDRSGWQSGTVSVALSNDGSATILFPNADGNDGVRHRERFAILTDDLYRIGEEWIEVYRGEKMRPEDLEIVFTPAGWRMDRGRLEIRGPDLMALYTLARSTELDVWHHAPRDVFEHYTRLPVALASRDFSGWTDEGAGTTADGWTYNRVAPSTSPPGVQLVPVPPAGAGDVVGHIGHDLDTDVAEPDYFEASARVTWTPDGIDPGNPLATTRLIVTDDDGTEVILAYQPRAGHAYLDGTAIIGSDVDAVANGWHLGGKVAHNGLNASTMRLVVRRRWVYGYVNGELVVWGRRRSEEIPPASIEVNSHSDYPIVQTLDFVTLAPFGIRGTDNGDLRLPGAPTAGGLRGRYWSEGALASIAAPIVGIITESDFLDLALDDTREPSDSRLDQVLDFASGMNTWQPPAAQPSSGVFSARWTGSIHLDLSGNGRRLRIRNLDGAARVWVGRTVKLADAIIERWEAGPEVTDIGVPGIAAEVDLRSDNLRDLLGQGSGWYPIVIEYVNDGGAAQINLEESALDGSGSPTGWAIVPATKLSPLGCYEETHRLESHRELLAAIADGYGYQWRVDPRKLESGEFPGQVIPRIRVGTDTDKIVANDRAIDLASEGDALEAIDRLLVDAAGIADPTSSQQLTAEIVNDPARSAGHLFLSTGVESLPEITEPDLLVQRGSSLVALRSGPNEQVSARPQDDTQELTDTYPMTGALGRRRWRPGDGLRLALEDLCVIDPTPRQLSAVTRPIYRDGVGVPEVGWRQRPRGLRAFLHRTFRAATVGRRNYQGQTAIVTGSLGTHPSSDDYTRVPLPERLANVVGFDIVFSYLDGNGTIEVNGTDTGITVDTAGRYPLNAYVARAGAGAEPRLYVRLIGAGVAAYEIFAELRVRI